MYLWIYIGVFPQKSNRCTDFARQNYLPIPAERGKFNFKYNNTSLQDQLVALDLRVYDTSAGGELLQTSGSKNGDAPNIKCSL